MPALPHPDLHLWDLAPKDAIALQRQLAARLISDRPLDLSTVHTVAGVDVSVKEGLSRAAIVVLALPGLEILETARASSPTAFPYVPGLLSFREGPVILAAYQKLHQTPDILIFDGQGQAHPRRLGIAAHIGLWIERPTVGCAKSWLIGAYEAVGQEKGDFAVLIAPEGDIIGVTLRTRSMVKPVYVSAGHLCDHESARKLVLACAPRYRLPEPIRAAHKAAGSGQ